MGLWLHNEWRSLLPLIGVQASILVPFFSVSSNTSITMFKNIFGEFTRMFGKFVVLF